MYKCMMKEALLFVGILLLVVNATWACNGGGGKGPCRQLNSDCGGLGGGMGTCAWDGMACSGVCPAYCPSGSADYHCKYISGDCAVETVDCSIMRKYRCETGLFGPPHCMCEEIGTGGPCPRMDCR